MPPPRRNGDSPGDDRPPQPPAFASGLLDAACDGVLCLDPNLRIRFANAAAEALLGFAGDEILGRQLNQLIPDDIGESPYDQIPAVLRANAGEKRWLNEGNPVTLLDARGQSVSLAVLLTRGDGEEGPMLAAMLRKPPPQQGAEAAQQRMHRALETVSAGHRALIRSEDEQSLLAEICRVAVEVGGYRFAWAGYAEQDPERTVRPVAHAGQEAGYLETIRVTWSEEASGQGPVGRAIRLGQPAIERDLRHSAAFTPWREAALERGFESVIAVPLAHDGQTFGALAIYAADADAFDTEEAWLLERLAGDLAYGLQVLHDRRSWREERDRLVAILEATPDFVDIADRDGNILYRNQGAWRMLGLPPDTDPGRFTIDDTQPQWAARRIRNEGFPTAREEGFWQGELAFLRADGTEVPVAQTVLAHFGPDGEVTHYATIARDISAEKRAQAEMDKLSSAIEQSGDLVWITDDRGIIEYVNPAFERVTGYRAQEARGERNSQLLGSGLHSEAFYEDLWATIRNGEVFRDVFTNRNRDGELFHLEETISPLRDSQGRIRHFVATGRDITENLRMQERIRSLAYYDPLTELPNRHLLDERLRQATTHLDRHSRIAAVALVDIDRFQQINESLGHAVGDRLLQVVAQRFAGIVREGDTVARFGGDQFAFLLDDLGRPDQVPGLLSKILDALAEPIAIGDYELVVTANAGSSLYPGDARDPDTLLKHADTALHRAKHRGRNQFVCFTPELDERGPEHLDLEADLSRALERGELFLLYQPQFDLGQGSLHGVEALLRWQHPERGLISPAQFVPLLEDLGLIEEVGDWVIQTAAEQAQAWADAGQVVPVAVNLSVRQFRSRDLADRIIGTVRRVGLGEGQFEVEITESLFLEESDWVAATLNDLHSAGIRLALDDFGTGYSALGYLRKFPLDVLKIDRAFIGEITEQQPAELVRAVVNMARPLGISPIAEGVETAGQARALRGMGCDLVQGFGLSPPVTADAIPALAAGPLPEPPEATY